MNDFTQETWKQAYADLLTALERVGIPNDAGKMIASNLRDERSMRRMIGYLSHMKRVRMEDIADEMLAIMEDRNKWIRKKQVEESNARYNAWLNSDLRGAEDE